MNTPSLLTNPRLVRNFFAHTALKLAVAFSLCLVLAACSDDESISPYLGDYSVVETNEDEEEDSYEIKINKTANGFEFTNFGDIMHVPVKAKINGKVLTIPAQTFVGKSLTIIVSGQGSFSDNGILTFDYSIDTGDDILLDYTCVATHQ